MPVPAREQDIGIKDMVRELMEGQEAMARTARSLVALAEKANGQPTLVS